MLSHSRLLFRYFRFISKAGNEHSIHSPFVYELYTTCIKPDHQFYIFKKIEEARDALKNSKTEIDVCDFGAGSKINSSLKRKISDIASNSEKSPNLAQILFRLVNYFKPQVTLDLGTSLGITTLYLATPNKTSQVYTFEGCENTANVALKNFQKLNCGNIKLISGNLDLTLVQTLEKINKVDFVFFDANHCYLPTISYFNSCLQKVHEESVFVFDDIHWSEEMEKAWEEIKNHPQVTVSIDLFFMGIVFFRKKQPKEHFFLRS